MRRISGFPLPLLMLVAADLVYHLSSVTSIGRKSSNMLDRHHRIRVYGS
jgi:hypothetical protein